MKKFIIHFIFGFLLTEAIFGGAVSASIAMSLSERDAYEYWFVRHL